MATLQTIRTKAGLLVAIVIGISLAAFILGDMFQGGSSILQKKRLKIGEINGESIQYPQFQQKVEELGDFYRMNSGQNQLNEQAWVQVREQTWQNMVRNLVMTDVYENLGITVSSDELFDMLQGTNLHPVIQQLFRNPNTGQVDRNVVIQFLKNLQVGGAPEQRKYWLYLEDQIVDEKIQSKYNNLVSKGIYITNLEAESNIERRNKQVNFDYIMLNRNSVADSQVVINGKDLRNYYNQHENDYHQDKLRRIEYVVFEVTPSKDDFNESEKWINEIVSDFKSAQNNISFVNANSDANFDDIWHSKANLPEDIAAWAYDKNTNVNDIYGPYFEAGAYKLTKLHKSEMMPDSVKARHILLQVTSPQEVQKKQALADSLKNAIEKGSNFASLAEKFSADKGTVDKGGDLGWFSRGQMVKPFEDAAFNNKINKVSIAQTQFGFHIIQTTKKSKLTKQVQLASIVRKVTPSSQTYQDEYANASKFAAKALSEKEFKETAKNQNLNIKIASLKENEQEIAGLENSRSLIRAAYDTEVGNVIQDQKGSTIFDLGDNFVISTLTAASEKGTATFESVKERVELAVLKEKKNELLVNKANNAIKGKNSLETIASELGADVNNATDINFNSFQIPGIGMEPKIIGTAVSLKTDEISNPISGNNGVFIIKVTSSIEGEKQNIENIKMRMAQNLGYRAASQAYIAHQEKAEIEDRRVKFY